MSNLKKRKPILGKLMKKKVLVITVILTAIFLGALCIRLGMNFKQDLLLGVDSPHYLLNTRYLLNNWPSLPGSVPPLTFNILAGFHALFSLFGASLMTSLKIGSALISAVVAFSVYFLTKRLTKNTGIAVLAAFLAVFMHANVRMSQDLWKNALAASLTPLSVLFFWQGIKTHKKINFLLAGFLLGLIALTHELSAGVLGIAYISYIAFVGGYRKQLPRWEIKGIAMTFLVAVPIGGAIFIANSGTIASVGSVSPFFAEKVSHQIEFYSEFIGPLLLVLAIIGILSMLYRRKAEDIFLLSWILSALILAQPCISTNYIWRFILLTGIPLAISASIGVFDGIRAVLNHFKKKRTIFLKRHLIFFSLILTLVTYQTCSAYAYSMQFHSSIDNREYGALFELRDNLGENVYLIGNIRYHYWIQLAGMKSLSEEECDLRVFRAPTDFSTGVEIYTLQLVVGENVYALVDPNNEEVLQKFEGPLFELVFDRSFMKVYALSENFQPPENLDNHWYNELVDSKPDYLAQLGANPLRVFFLPIDFANYFLSDFWSSAVKFAVAVPLTIFLWVLLVSLVWGVIWRRIKS